uniref:Lipocalin/cytosolic fatty-acid binding domain-containing protein n=1 Tax=Amblyomma maculatum TaxID=34609 RepID=G3MPC6_AMBMU
MEVAFRCAQCLVLLLVFASTKTEKCHPVDVIKMIGYFPSMTAIYASPPAEGESVPQCLHGVLTQYQPDGGNITYVWTMRDDSGKESTIIHQVSKGPSLDQANVTSSNDPGNSFIATAPYTDYKTCFVLQTGDLGGQCLLWVNDEYRNDFPKECTRKYQQYCGKGVNFYSEEDCSSTA